MYHQAVGGPDCFLCRLRLLQLAARSSAGPAMPGASLPLAGCEAVDSSTDGGTHTSRHSPAVGPPHPEAATHAVSQACRSSEPGQVRPTPSWTEQGHPAPAGSSVSLSGALRAGGPDVRACPGLHTLFAGMPVKQAHQHEGVGAELRCGSSRHTTVVGGEVATAPGPQNPRADRPSI